MRNCDFNEPRKPQTYRFYYHSSVTNKEVNVSFEFHNLQSALAFAELPVPGLTFLRYERV